MRKRIIPERGQVWRPKCERKQDGWWDRVIIADSGSGYWYEQKGLGSIGHCSEGHLKHKCFLLTN